MIVEFVDKLDDTFDVADNDDVDIAEDKFVDNREDTVKGVESSGDNTTTDETEYEKQSNDKDNDTLQQ